MLGLIETGILKSEVDWLPTIRLHQVCVSLIENREGRSMHLRGCLGRREEENEGECSTRINPHREFFFYRDRRNPTTTTKIKVEYQDKTPKGEIPSKNQSWRKTTQEPQEEQKAAKATLHLRGCVGIPNSGFPIREPDLLITKSQMQDSSGTSKYRLTN